MAERIVLEYDASDAIESADKANKAIESNERAVGKTNAAVGKLSGSHGILNRMLETAEKKAALLAGSLGNLDNHARKVHAALVGMVGSATAAGAAFHSSAGGILAFAKANIVAEAGIAKAFNAYKAFRIASALPFGAAAVGLTAGFLAARVVLEKALTISNDFGKSIEKNAIAAAESGKAFASIQTFA